MPSSVDASNAALACSRISSLSHAFASDARGLGLRETAFSRSSREAAEPCDTRVELEGEYVLH
jgi:hypothetical protein